MRQQGFVLVAAIWLLAILAMAAGFFSLWLQRSIELAQIQLDRSQGTIDIQSTQSTVLYMLSTYGISQAGIEIPSNTTQQQATMSLDDFFQGAKSPAINDMGERVYTIDGNEIHMNNTSYKGMGSSYFAIQDNAGLINITQIKPHQLTRLLDIAGYGANTNPEELIDKLQDYIDPDDLHRLNGAESYHYRQASMHPPANAELKTSLQISSILGWNQYPNLLINKDIMPALSIAPKNLMNINTATKVAMMVELEIDDVTAEKLIQTRNESPFASINEVTTRANLPIANLFEQATTFPSTTFRIYFWHKDARLEREISIKLNDFARHSSPWLIANDLSQTLSEQHANAESQKPETHLFD